MAFDRGVLINNVAGLARAAQALGVRPFSPPLVLLRLDGFSPADRLPRLATGGCECTWPEGTLAHIVSMLSGLFIRAQGSMNAEGVDQMRIAVVGRGNVGGGLADLWERAGHEVKRIGREGDDVSEAEVVLLAVPGGAVAEALEKVEGFDGKTVIDATNLYGVGPPDGFPSNAEFVKSKTNGPTAKSFNTNEASLYSRLGDARARPSNLWCGDAEARQVVEQLNRDAGYDPVYMGPLENAATLESLVVTIFAIRQGMGPFLYRMAPPEQL